MLIKKVHQEVNAMMNFKLLVVLIRILHFIKIHIKGLQAFLTETPKITQKIQITKSQ